MLLLFSFPSSSPPGLDGPYNKPGTQKSPRAGLLGGTFRPHHPVPPSSTAPAPFFPARAFPFSLQRILLPPMARKAPGNFLLPLTRQRLLILTFASLSRGKKGPCTGFPSRDAISTTEALVLLSLSLSPLSHPFFSYPPKHTLHQRRRGGKQRGEGFQNGSLLGILVSSFTSYYLCAYASPGVVVHNFRSLVPDTLPLPYLPRPERIQKESKKIHHNP